MNTFNRQVEDGDPLKSLLSLESKRRLERIAIAVLPSLVSKYHNHTTISYEDIVYESVMYAKCLIEKIDEIEIS